MAPKNKFSKQDIIDAAFNVAKVEGIDTITIRKVAEKLGSSIAPIYVNFNDIEELKQEVVNKTLEVAKQLLLDQNSGQPFRDIGIASLRFAKEYSVLFRDLIIKHNSYMNYDKNDVSLVVEMMKKDDELSVLSDEELMNILFKMQIFQTGLSVMAANGLLPDHLQDEQLIEVLDSVALDIVTAACMRQKDA
ncbi:TetR/AcrR family transcriptional regulator [Paenibacillus albiflavus]|uniref:TetR/AcrR family transcriptional regulator n=1 Tax=Paenibacillus albiflavus TaxID=2545760 RepID=A0A4R4EEP4_9BACL|nr:TetR family transcriptional regulator [Paenibacillus albiflavus]TCZ76651.1 TetR/AcrR family transcriptional regulator [Paenibacillus albiflavus]